MRQDIVMPPERQQSIAVQQDQEVSMLATISRLALDPRCDMEKLERLMALQERMEAKSALLPSFSVSHTTHALHPH